jgi:hypothetical protein
MAGALAGDHVFRITYASAHTTFCVQETMITMIKFVTANFAEIYDPLECLLNRLPRPACQVR